MLKKTITFTLLICSALFSAARGIDPSTAAQVAKNFFYERASINMDVTYSSIDARLIKTGMKEQETVYYAFTFGEKGFVVVAADDCVVPVLCYSFESSWGEGSEPIQFSEWMDNYGNQVVYHRKRQSEPSPEIIADWKRLMSDNPTPLLNLKGAKSVEPLLISTWDQGGHYNALCPTAQGGPAGRVWAGCVATAMAQVMYYYRWPLTGVGSHSYNSSYGMLSANFGATTYDWNGMLNSLNADNLPVATLIYHCGVAVDMMYSPNGSGAYSDDAADAMKSYFRYANTTHMVSKQGYSATAWANLMKAQLDAKKPMYYHGFGSGGHAFNLDGYQDNNYFHFNWGWSGSYNGYYYLDNLNPGGSDFTSGQGAMIDVVPDGNYPPYCSGNTVITETSGTLEDGSGPYDYQNGTDCWYLISPQVSPDDSISSIKITFNRFSTETNEDVLTIYNGSTTASPVIGTYSGSSLPQAININGNAVLLHFTTNSSNSNSGWFLTFQSKFPEYCDGLKTLKALSNTIEDGSGAKKYNNKTLCQWLIWPPNAQKITLTFDQFDLEQQFDFVEIYDFDTTTSNGNLLAHYSGHSVPPPVVSNTGAMFIIFYTNSLNNFNGWKAHYLSQQVGIEENAAFGDVSIYPNPASDILNITMEKAANGQYECVITDMSGRAAITELVNVGAGKHQICLSTSSLSPGLYTLKVKGTEGILVRKLIIDHP